MPMLTSRLAAALAYPRAPSEYVELANPLHASAGDPIRARVVAVRAETHDVATVVLRPPRPVPHRAGQWVALDVAIGGVRRTRCFSVASAEGARDLALTIKAQPGGLVTPRLVRGELDERVVRFARPAGDFVLPDVLPDRVLLLAGGSGITPLLSMRRTHGAKVRLEAWARSGEDVLFPRELDASHVGPFSAEVLPRDFERWETWACGPPGFLAAVLAAYEARGAAHRVRTERFSLGAASAGGEADEVTFARSQQRARGGGPILALAERAGLRPASGCRMGLCRSCTCRKVSGATRDLRTGVVSSEAGVDIQICVSEPVGPVSIDL